MSLAFVAAYNNEMRKSFANLITNLTCDLHISLLLLFYCVTFERKLVGAFCLIRGEVAVMEL